jgi:hypothetical protein
MSSSRARTTGLEVMTAVGAVRKPAAAEDPDATRATAAVTVDQNRLRKQESSRRRPVISMRQAEGPQRARARLVLRPPTPPSSSQRLQIKLGARDQEDLPAAGATVLEANPMHSMATATGTGAEAAELRRRGGR